MNVHPVALILALSASLVAPPASAAAMDDAALAEVVRQRLHGDRTGACLAVAVVEKDNVARSFQCADPADAGRIGPDSAFEIGSVSKTMVATLLAQLVLEGKGSLDDTLASWLPPGTPVPDWQGQPILLRHVVTHTSGLPALPSRLGATGMDDPYANLDADALLASLGDAKLAAAPGSAFEYSNFASMVLSYAVARRAGMDFESLLRQRLFVPLGMDGAYVDAPPPEGVRAAIGHTPNRRPTPAWHFATDLAGVGGVRATLEDMVRYVQAGLGWRGEALQPALRLTHAPLSQQPPMAMNWMLARAGERQVLVHEGGTGGFSAFVAIDPQRGRGVVILSDTTWNSIGSLGSLGQHLVDESFPLGKPRREVAADPALLQALAGEYQLQGGMKMTLRTREGRLHVQAEGQGEYAMGHDDAGDFYPLELDAVLHPLRKADGRYGFTWMQMGAMVPATRIEPGAAAPPAPTAEALRGYAGDYPLLPGFSLAVREQGGVLTAQATGQGAFPLQATAADTFEAAAFGIEIRFLRDAAGEVQSLELHQGGQVLRGRRE
ncbi:serine hydrolase domain-containing protein [Pseudoxanthomonas jiangsuensis]|uniref:serine hydrolase domain-containing protein n=1 Tax=Pseudoxanthomonas jiangsuensis TaxID=619688 RepID=UPI001391425B|nr:serine hydrolase domain-containing protein [Pseudoxanthomonas jiangsuensis]